MPTGQRRKPSALCLNPLGHYHLLMSYQVLARKWRPKNFAEMVGQEHVLRALQNALTQNRLHHAYLFTGTRGVGKTTLARILAKCLNCDTGVTATPCGECGSCLSISEGRMVDLIEVDAASRTKVEDTRELLENVQYAPTQGRYKVYIIDEVHMLTVNSFNALLKTLEEPPPHVKFLLATTDPQKLPVTVLSRCLQFHLKNMSPERIVGHLEHILGEESIAFEQPALWQLAHAADGSMRDALSLTDQAIGYGDRNLREQDVSAMLGTLNQQWVLRLLQALAGNDVAAIFDIMEQISELAPDYSGLLSDVIALLHRLAIAQVLPSGLDNRDGLRTDLLKLATQIPSEDIQLFYQSALISRRDLPLSPSPRAGVEMALLRMLAFRPQGVVDLPKTPLNLAEPSEDAQLLPEPQVEEAIVEATVTPVPTAASPSAVENTEAKKKTEFDSLNELSRSEDKQDTVPKHQAQPHPPSELAPTKSQAPAYLNDVLNGTSNEPLPTVDNTVRATSVEATSVEPAPQTHSSQTLQSLQHERSPAPPPKSVKTEPTTNTTLPHPSEWQPTDWLAAFQQLAITGIVKSIASNCELKRVDDQTLHFVLNQEHSVLYNETLQERLADAINRYFETTLTVRIEIGDVHSETPAQVAERISAQKQAEAIASIQQDPLIQAITQAFGAVIDPKNISTKV